LLVIVCRFCRSSDGALVLDLGAQPSSEQFPLVTDPGPDARFVLRLWLCASCGLAQLADDDAGPEDALGDEPAALTAQRRDAVEALAKNGMLPASGPIVEFPSPHGGTWVDLLAEHGLRAGTSGEPAAVVVDGCFGVMHEIDQRAALQARADALGPDGVLIVQYHSLAAILAGSQWNAVRSGHYAYYSTPAMVGMLAAVGLTATSAHRFELYGGTVAVTASRAGTPEPSVAEICDAERAVGVLDAGAFADLQASVSRTADGLRDQLTQLAAQGRRVYGYSAASRAVALLSLAAADARVLAGVADASASKQGKRMPGTDIPIIAADALVAAEPDVVLLFVSDLMAEVRQTLPGIAATAWVDAGSGR
jgi:C-methyltransferase C-terminal domain/Putative zinc binding domain